MVVDAGIATDADVAWMNAQGHDWIAVSRGGKPPSPEGAPGAVPLTAAQHEVRAWRCAETDGEARLHVVGEGKKATEDSILEMKRSRFEAALDNFHQGLSIKGRLKERYARVAGHHEIRVEKAATGPNAKALRHTRKTACDDADEEAGT